MDKASYRAGDAVELRASASATTRTVTARMYGVPPVTLRWDPKSLANTARFTLPRDIAPGRYTLTVTAEDMAHNIGAEEVQINVLP
jgi:Ca-activated chloride channel family protein